MKLNANAESIRCIEIYVFKQKTTEKYKPLNKIYLNCLKLLK